MERGHEWPRNPLHAQGTHCLEHPGCLGMLWFWQVPLEGRPGEGPGLRFQVLLVGGESSCSHGPSTRALCAWQVYLVGLPGREAWGCSRAPLVLAGMQVKLRPAPKRLAPRATRAGH